MGGKGLESHQSWAAEWEAGEAPEFQGKHGAAESQALTCSAHLSPVSFSLKKFKT